LHSQVGILDFMEARDLNSKLAGESDSKLAGSHLKFGADSDQTDDTVPADTDQTKRGKATQGSTAISSSRSAGKQGRLHERREAGANAGIQESYAQQDTRSLFDYDLIGCAGSKDVISFNVMQTGSMLFRGGGNRKKRRNRFEEVERDVMKHNSGNGTTNVNAATDSESDPTHGMHVVADGDNIQDTAFADTTVTDAFRVPWSQRFVSATYIEPACHKLRWKIPHNEENGMAYGLAPKRAHQRKIFRKLKFGRP
jgi:hypothetical protein